MSEENQDEGYFSTAMRFWNGEAGGVEWCLCIVLLSVSLPIGLLFAICYPNMKD